MPQEGYRCDDCRVEVDRCTNCRARRALVARQRRARAKKAGFCADCSRKAVKGQIRCKECAERINEMSSAAHARRRSAK